MRQSKATVLMLVRNLSKHFPARIPEWWNAGAMFAWGSYILLHPGIFQDDVYAGFVALVGGDISTAERTWGLIAVTVGLVRGAALFVNGAYSRTPLIRLATSAISAFVWAQVVISLGMLGRPNTGVVMHSAAVGLDLISAYRASCDAVIAEVARRNRVGSEKSGKSDCSGAVVAS